MTDIAISLTCAALILFAVWEYLSRLNDRREAEREPSASVELSAWADSLDDDEREIARELRARVYHFYPGANPLDVERWVRYAMENPAPYSGPSWPDLEPETKAEA